MCVLLNGGAVAAPAHTAGLGENIRRVALALLAHTRVRVLSEVSVRAVERVPTEKEGGRNERTEGRKEGRKEGRTKGVAEGRKGKRKEGRTDGRTERDGGDTADGKRRDETRKTEREERKKRNEMGDRMVWAGMGGVEPDLRWG